MWRRTWLVFSQAVTVALGVLFVLVTLKPEWLPRPAVGGMLPAPTLVQMVPAPAPAAGVSETADARRMLSMAAAAQAASPAVASVTALRNGNALSDPRNPFARDMPRSQQLGLGSAVIVAPEGYLLTNHHVVDGATDIEVQLADGRQARARLVGSDPETDIAVLKIEMDNLPVVTLGAPGSLHVGDAVLAIGNPFNVGQTVTSGIVSALDRSRLTESPFQSFIQTDAAINPGNSGGALVDAYGALVGINTAIFSGDGSNLGIGFAVPVDTARLVMEALLRDGQVRRGWLGVQQRTLTPDLADALNLPVKQGALIIGVLQDGPAARAGLRPGDVVTRVANRAVVDINELLATVAMLAPDSQTMLTVHRGTEELQLPVRLGQRPPPPRRRS